ncbi:hypothetical protein GCM10027440_51940 [Nocardiopsis coralliicola]
MRGGEPAAVQADPDCAPSRAFGVFADGNLIAQRDSVEDIHQIVVSIFARRPHRQLEVHLRGDPNGHGGTSSGHESSIVKEPPPQ